MDILAGAVVSLGAFGRYPGRVLVYLRSQRMTWLDDDLLCACRYPRRAADFEELAARDVALIVNLHERPHRLSMLETYRLRELHLPVPDFGSPTPAQIEEGLAAIAHVVASGHRVAVHCGGGLGRTGTLLACYFVNRGLSADDALARIRSARPGSVETPRQEAAVRAYARQHRR